MPLSVIGVASPEGAQVSVSSGVSVPPPHVQWEGDLWSMSCSSVAWGHH